MRNLLRFAGLLPCALLMPTVMAGELELLVVNEADQPIPCRVLVRPEGAECVIPERAVELRTGRDHWFMSPGRCRVPVPDNGQLLLRIERGAEYLRIKQTLEASTIRGPVKFVLRRWINMAERGYACGENHLHVDTGQLASMLAAEGLDFGTSLTWWRGPDDRRPIPAGDGRVRMLEFGGHQSPTTIFDAELEYAWGAAYIQNLPHAMPLLAEPGRPNLDYLQHAADHGALVHYQGGWSREVLLDALLGCVHTVNVCNNNFALHRFQPRSNYSNLLQVDGFPIYPDTDVGMLQMNTDTYYRLLNCGLKLSVGAGTATGVKQAPVGYNRTYVQMTATGAALDTAEALGDFYAAWRAGRNFVTNGPMLLLRTESNQQPGDTIELNAAGEVLKLQVEAIWEQTLASVELLRNGEVVATISSDGQRHVRESVNIRVDDGCWIAARCTAQDGLLSDEELLNYRDDSGQTTFRVAPSRLRFAHTSPIYVHVAGRGAAVPESIREGLRMLDHFAIFARDTASEQYREEIINATRRARAELEARLR